MEPPRELQMALINDFSSIRSIEATYSDGSTISGFAKKIRPIPFQVTLCKHEVYRGENPYVLLDFKRISRITVEHHSGKTEVFE